MPGRASPGRAVLALVVDRAATRHPLAEAVAAAVAAGVDWIQLRDRELEGAAWLAWADEIAIAARSARTEARILVNRRIDVALAMDADGVHLGFDALRVEDARALLGDAAWIGVSTHAPEEARTAAAAGADYVHLAPIFDPLSKAAERPALGPGALAAARGAGVPVIAQGGIDAARAGEAVRSGAAGVAVTGAILLAEDPGEAAAALRGALDIAAREATGPETAPGSPERA